MALNLNIISKFNPKGINDAQSAFGKIGGSLKTFAGLAATAFATIGAGAFLKESIKQASDLGESINAVNKAYGEYAKDVLALGDDVASRLGLSTVDFNAAAVRFSAFAEKVVGQGGDVAGFVDDISSRAADFASVFNIEVSEALRVFQSGLSGEAEPLKRFGINLLDSEVKAYAYANGIANVGAQLTETEKVQARYGLLLQSTAKTAGDFADTSDGLANSQRILQASVQNLQAQVGEGLTPVLATVTSALVPIAETIFPVIANFLNEKIAPGAQKAADAFKTFAVGLRADGFDIEASFARLGESVKAFFDSGRIEKLLADSTQMRIAFFNALTESLPGVLTAFIDFIPRIVSFFVNDLLPVMLKQLTGIIQQLAQLLVVLLPQLATSLLGAIPMLLQAAITLFKTLVQAVIEIVPELVETIINLLPTLVDSIMEMLPGILEAAVDLFTALVDSIPIVLPVLLKAIFDLLPVIIDTLISMLPQLIKGAFQLFIGLVTGLANATPKIIGEVIKLIPLIVQTLLDNMPKLINAGLQIVAGIAQGILENAPRLLAEAAKTIGNTLIEGVKGLLGIKSPSKVFYGIGENVGEGLVWGILNSRESVAAATKALIDSATRAAATAVKEGKPYANYGKEQFETLPGGGTVNIGGFTDLINDMIRDTGNLTQGLSKVEKALGGTTAQLLDAMFEQQTFVRGNTQVITGTSEAEAASLIAQGFEPVARLEKPIQEILENINQVSEDFYKEINTKFGRSGDAGLIPLAAGGFIKKPIPALVGEAGPELVIPLDRVESMFGLSNRSQSNPVEININVQAGMGADPNTISREIIDAIKRYERINGPVFVSA